MYPILNNIIKTMCFYMLTQTHEREARGGGQTPLLRVHFEYIVQQLSNNILLSSYFFSALCNFQCDTCYSRLFFSLDFYQNIRKRFHNVIILGT